MTDTLIGRERETQLLKKYVQSGRPELIAIYGRRRVGKTFLVRHFFKDKVDFYVTGVIEGSRAEQMNAFTTALRQYGYEGKSPETWIDAFIALGELLRHKAAKKRGPMVVFIDELPCFSTLNSRFVKAFGYFWNSQASWIDNMKLIICGSATSWMIRNVMDNRGGLHNRVTHEIHLHPFKLRQCESFFQHYKFGWDRMSILQIYMAVGGIPYYLKLLDKDKSVAENIDSLFFSKDATLKLEFRRLFYSLFSSPDIYLDIVRLLASKKKGLTRTEIAEKLKKQNNGHLGDTLRDLEYCDFIRSYSNRKKKQDAIYQLTDHFTFFYTEFVDKGITDTHFWRNKMGTPTQNTWYGFAFERVCLSHIAEIKQTLHLDTIWCEYYAWRSRETTPAAQIDLLLDRADGIITICEMKYSKTMYVVNKDEYNKMMNRISAFVAETRWTKGVQMVMVTTVGLKKNMYSSEFSGKTVCLNDLFSRLADY